MATRNPSSRSSRRWLLADGGYVLLEGARTVGGPYPEIALVYGPEPKIAVRPQGRPRKQRPADEAGERGHEQLGAAISLMARAGENALGASAAAPQDLGPIVLLMTAPRDAAVQFAADVVRRLQAEGHADASERVIVAAGAFDPSVVNAALVSAGHARAFLSDWHSGRARLLGDGPDAGDSDGAAAPSAPRG